EPGALARHLGHELEDRLLRLFVVPRRKGIGSLRGSRGRHECRGEDEGRSLHSRHDLWFSLGAGVSTGSAMRTLQPQSGPRRLDFGPGRAGAIFGGGTGGERKPGWTTASRTTSGRECSPSTTTPRSGTCWNGSCHGPTTSSSPPTANWPSRRPDGSDH